MLKNISFFIVLLFTTVIFSQKKEKIKGSKIIKTEKINTKAITELEIEDNTTVILIKAEKSSLEIEADDNLFNVINYKQYGNVLRLNTNKEILSFKKFEIKVFYTDSLKMITVKHEAKLNALSEINIPSITIKTFDFSKSNIYSSSANFYLLANDKSKIELNLKSENGIIELSKNAELKGILNGSKLKLDMYQNTSAKVEGDITEMKLRLDNDANYLGKNLNTKLMHLTADGNADIEIFNSTNLDITASNKSKIYIYGEPKIDLKKFSDEATLFKRKKN